MDGVALEDRDECSFVNTAKVKVDVASLDTSIIAVDVLSIIEGLDFVAPIYDPETFEPIGETLGVECHSSPMQPDCATIFGHFGIEMSSGAANAGTNAVFSALD